MFYIYTLISEYKNIVCYKHLFFTYTLIIKKKMYLAKKCLASHLRFCSFHSWSFKNNVIFDNQLMQAQFNLLFQVELTLWFHNKNVFVRQSQYGVFGGAASSVSISLFQDLFDPELGLQLSTFPPRNKSVGVVATEN